MCQVAIIATEIFKPGSDIERHFILEVIRSYCWQWPIFKEHVQVHVEPAQIIVEVNFRDRLSPELVAGHMSAFREAIQSTLRYLPLLTAYERAVKAMSA